MSDSPVKLDTIGFIMLGVSEMTRSLAFYRDRLGMSVTFQIPGYAFLYGGPVPLVLSESLWDMNGGRPGSTEVVFTVENVRATLAALESRGVTFTREPHPVNAVQWAANFDDPDGHHLSIFGPEGGA